MKVHLGSECVFDQEGHWYVTRFPDEFTLQENHSLPHTVLFIDERRGRLWLQVANGTAEYLVAKSPHGTYWTAQRLYADLHYPREASLKEDLPPDYEMLD